MPQNATVTLDALDELVEVFVGISHELEWSTSEDISRKELLPILVMCQTGTLKPDQALEVILSNISVKRDETFAVLLKIVQRLNTQLAEYDLVRREAVRQHEEPNSAEYGNGGEEPV